MELKSAKCPNCGGKLELNPAIEKGICIYCGSEIIVAEAIQRFKGEISGIATVEKSLIRANQLLEDGDGDGAMKAFRHVIEVDPTNAEAFWGMYLCELATANYYAKLNSGMQRCWLDYYNSVKEAEDKYARRAIQYASPEKRTEYEAIANQKQAEAYSKLAEIDRNSKNSGGCYIATAVYGSYQAPEVLTLRKFRDEVLASTMMGRLFIKTYYLLSPPVANWLKDAKSINGLVKKILDRFVLNLRNKEES